MKNVDVDIYISQVIKFFETNPEELKLLIGDLDKNNFFEKIKELAFYNYQNGEDAQLTRKQLLELVVSMNREFNQIIVKGDSFLQTIYGTICLN
jgi:hypothetical protein